MQGRDETSMLSIATEAWSHSRRRPSTRRRASLLPTMEEQTVPPTPGPIFEPLVEKSLDRLSSEPAANRISDGRRHPARSGPSRIVGAANVLALRRSVQPDTVSVPTTTTPSRASSRRYRLRAK